MNNNRLSTSAKPKIVRDELLADIANLLSKPSNYKRGADGRVLVVSEGKFRGGKRIGVEIIYPDGKIAKSFKSGSECAKFLGLPLGTFFFKLDNNKSVIFDNKECNLKRVLKD
jgi:hypothetical protein